MLVDDRNKFITLTYKYSEYLNLSEEELLEQGLTEEQANKK